MKIYVHHSFSESFFYRLFHNTSNRIFNNNVVLFDYNNDTFEVIFDKNINDNNDGFHLLDSWADWEASNILLNEFSDIEYIHRIIDIAKDKKNWIINIFRTEKLLGKYDTEYVYPSVLKPYTVVLEDMMMQLSNNKIVSDNCFINTDIELSYPNHYFAFTNTIYRWNEMISIRWFYEFKELFDRLNFKYDLMYSVRNHRKYRLDILEELSKLNNEKILLQETNSIDNIIESKFHNVNFNSMEGNNDFSNLNLIHNFYGVNWDIFFRMLSKSKMQILDESWSYQSKQFNSQYLSEKTIGLILAGIPFISTHSYPLYILEKSLGIRPHPFMSDFETLKGNPNLFAKFVEKFMSNFNENYEQCRMWTNECHTLMMDKIENENSLLDLILNNFKKEGSKTSKLI